MGSSPSKQPDIHVVVVSPQPKDTIDSEYLQTIIRESKGDIRNLESTKPTKSDTKNTTDRQCNSDAHGTVTPTRTDTADSFREFPTGNIPESRLSYLSSSETTGRETASSTSGSFTPSLYAHHGSKSILRSSSFTKPTLHSKKSPLSSKSYTEQHKKRNLRLDELRSESFVSTVSSVKAGSEQKEGVDGGAHSGNMFEIFEMDDGREFTVYVREDKKKFYVDWEQQKWRHFPLEWERRGKFHSMDYHKTSEPGNMATTPIHDPGYIEFHHPTAGKMYMWFQKEYSNKLYFYQEKSGTWVPTPLSWEGQVPTIAKMVKDIQEMVPSWTDKMSIVSTLRQCNYNVDDTISAYLTIKDAGGVDSFPTLSSTQEIYVEQLKRELTRANQALKESNARNAELKHHIEDLQMKVDELEDELDEQSLLQASAATELFPPVDGTGGEGGVRMSATQVQYQQTVCLLAQSTRSVKAKLLASRATLAKMIDMFRSKFSELSVAVRKLTERCRRLDRELSETKMLYRREFHQRKALHNEILELKGNIRVFCRCRPDDSDANIVAFPEECIISCPTLQGKSKKYEFDQVFDPFTTQEQVFKETRPIVMSCVDGYNVCIVAYGQTSTGKTYTMMGPADNPGVNVRALRELFDICKSRDNVKYRLTVSMIEIYNETIADLLTSGKVYHGKLNIHKQGGEVYIPGLSEIEVTTMKDVESIIEAGEKNRKVANTVMNTNSSRSHLLLVLTVEGHDRVSKTISKGRLTLVDLAGSERISRTEAKGIRLVEAAAINKSLSALGQVFAAIRNNALHIPYRNSKLTHFLSSSLGGDAKACMFVMVSPVKANQGETLSSLDFGLNARQVELGKASRHIHKPAVV